MTFAARSREIITTATAVAVGVFVSLMTATVVGGVFWRYVLGNSQPWTEELSRYLMIWSGFLGASLAVRSGAHVSLQFLSEALPHRAGTMVRLFATLIFTAFLGFVIWQGSGLVRDTMDQVSPVLQVPMGYAYAAVPMGCALMLFQLLFHVREELSGVIRPSLADRQDD